jgi:hypothetical protein
MAEIKEVNDKSSESVPTLKQMRESQKAGGEGTGLPENSTGKLNECQGHEADVKE